jgi:hypothetical protein
MRLTWHFTETDLKAVRRIVQWHDSHPIVIDRRERNLASHKPAVSRERFWRALMLALLTTQQPSGPNSAVSRFLATKPFPLSYRLCKASARRAAFATEALVSFGGIRRHGVIGSAVESNLDLLDTDEWPILQSKLKPLASLADATTERAVADYLADRFVGLGPKQARNLLQVLGLTRYEIPIDSRIAKWLRSLAFPVPVSASALSDHDYYCFVLDGIQRLCEAVGVLPCVVDGAVFASFDQDEWNAELVQF